MKSDGRIFQLSTRDIPKKWININPDLPEPLSPFLNPADGTPVPLEAMQALFPESLLAQEVSMEREIEIPEDILETYSLYRPTPLVRARFLERALDTPAKIFFKNEGVSPTGSHKPNTAIPQVYYNHRAGIKKLTTETGAGQWGSALSFAGSRFGMDIRVFMVRVSYEQKPYRRVMMQTYGGNVVASPSEQTEVGRRLLQDETNRPGSLGMAISEAVELAGREEGTNYALGSVLNHVLLHQTVIGQEAKQVLDGLGLKPDVVIGCHGGGSNFGGMAIPFLYDKMAGRDIDFVASEPLACPTLSKGLYAYDYGDAGKYIPLAKMYTLGHDFVPPSVHAGGLRYHGASPIVSILKHSGLIRAEALRQMETFEAALLFARTEGIIPAPESAHAIASAIRAAKACRERDEEKVILFNLSGHGHFDMASYQAYFSGGLEDFEYPEEEVRRAEAQLPRVEMKVNA
ncbi:MAG TPA: TrpB-like pyridoxal phosphate-dependent enzyme [Sediminispirochaeta sp.]|nr:TrpB-like pyridoxal phosphate-dependent enzyme [Sediminispirochaeta sp.]